MRANAKRLTMRMISIDFNRLKMLIFAALFIDVSHSRHEAARQMAAQAIIKYRPRGNIDMITAVFSLPGYRFICRRAAATNSKL